MPDLTSRTTRLRLLAYGMLMKHLCNDTSYRSLDAFLNE